MSWTLKTLSVCPPGEFIYKQTAPSGKEVKFVNSDAYELSKKVADWRKANALPRATADEALEDMVAFTCQRLGNHPGWCYNTDKSIAQSVPKRRTGGGCSSCGAHV